MITRASLTLTVAATFLMLFGNPASAPGQPDQLLTEAHALYERGRDDEALAKLQQVLASDPSSEQAFILMNQLEFREWAKIMIKEGRHAALVRELMGLAVPAREAQAGDRERIRELVGTLESTDWAERTEAMRKLMADHGEYVVPTILARLGSDSTDVRARTMEWLRRMGVQAVLPLIQALESENDLVASNAATVLGQIGDRRAAPYLELMAGQPEGNEMRTSAARKALGEMGVTDYDLRSSFLELAESLYRRDSVVVDPFRATYIVWAFDDGALVAREVPRDVYHLKLAEDILFDWIAVDPGDTNARVLLVSVLLAQAAAGGAEAAADEAGPGAALVEASILAAAQGTDVLALALHKAIVEGRDEVGSAAATLLGSMIESSEIGAQMPLEQALSAPNKRIRIAAALALAGLDCCGPECSCGDELVGVLCEAVQQTAVRTAVVIDDNPDTANSLRMELSARGVTVTAADNGAIGLTRVMDYPIEDLTVIRYELADQSVTSIVRRLRTDERTSGNPIAIVVDEARLTEAQEALGERVNIFITNPGNTAAYMVEMLGLMASLDAARADATSTASAAAEVLAGMALPEALAARVQTCLLGALDADDSVRVPGMTGLGRFGTLDAAGPLLAVLQAGEASEAARGAAALAIGNISRRAGQVPEGFVDGLRTAVLGAGTPVYLVVLGAAVGVAPLNAEQRDELLRMLRARITVDLTE